MVVAAALREEAALLFEVLRAAGRLDGVTPFAGRSGIDLLAHLTLLDRMACDVLDAPDRYERELAAFAAATASAAPEELMAAITSFARTRAEGDPQEWHDGCVRLCDALDRRGGDAEIAWFGRTMTVSRLAAARQMEVFAYGQDIVDLLGADRPATDRLWPVADFAVRTFGFSFANRGEPKPATQPHVGLDAPSGERWVWGDPASEERVEGAARDFCLVATQRRHVADTGLRVTGAIAARWMEISQTIAGPPTRGPMPGERTNS